MTYYMYLKQHVDFDQLTYLYGTFLHLCLFQLVPGLYPNPNEHAAAMLASLTSTLFLTVDHLL